MAKLGMMEGRLLPPEAGRFQSFPRDRWAEEFRLATEVPVSYIEWIYDGYGSDVNPLMHDLPRLKSLMDETGVTLPSICADYFMEYPFVRCSESRRAENERMLVKLLGNARQIGAWRVVLPFVDNAEIVTSEELETVVGVLERALKPAHTMGVALHLETSLGPDAFRALLDRLPDPMIRVNYDTGNSSALGYKPREELSAYGPRIGSVHIKDRKLGAGSVPLGTGDTNFAAFFEGLRSLKYTGDFTLQAARSQAGEEVAWARESRSFVARNWVLE